MTADRIMICQHPNGDGLYVPVADHVTDRCFQDCDCTPKMYVAEACGKEAQKDGKDGKELEADRVLAERDRFRADLSVTRLERDMARHQVDRLRAAGTRLAALLDDGADVERKDALTSWGQLVDATSRSGREGPR